MIGRLLLIVSLAATLSAQGPIAVASPDDWEEILFPPGSATLSMGYPTLLRLARLLSDHPDYRVRLTGNADSTEAANSALSERLALQRAEAVAAFLVKYGGRPAQIESKSDGKRNPKVPNASLEGRFANRRVTITVTGARGEAIREGGVSDVIRAMDPPRVDLRPITEAQMEVLKRLDKLDDIRNQQQQLEAQVRELQARLAQMAEQQRAPQLSTGYDPSIVIRNRGRVFLLPGEKEPPGYGLYSYVLFASEARNDDEKRRYTDLLRSFLRLRELASIERAIRADQGSVRPAELHMAIAPMLRPPSSSDAETLLKAYDFDVAGVLLSKLPLGGRKAAPESGAFFAWSLQPLSGQAAPQALVQKLDWIPPGSGDLVDGWYRVLIDKAETPRRWNKKSLQEYALTLQTEIEVFARRIPEARNAMLASLQLFTSKSDPGKRRPGTDGHSLIATRKP